MSRFACLSLSCLCLFALSTAVRGADDKPPPQIPPAMMDDTKGAQPADQNGAVIKPEEAKNNIGKEVTVEFVVVGGRLLEDKGICFLNSSTVPDDPDGFTAVIYKSGVKKFKDDAKIDNPADHFSQKKIRVSGKISQYKDKPQAQIIVNSPDQIKMVEEGAAPEGGAPAGGAPAGDATPENKM